ncbi:hypothetical protein ACFL96_16060 [Thermoproteota archaeon]
MGKISRGIECSVIGCSESAVRSVSKNKTAGSDIKTTGERQVYLCRAHYKALKKTSKSQDDIERIRWKS